MQVILHTGAHCTDDDRLLKSLLKNKGVYSKQGVEIPNPSKFRRLMRQTLMAMRTSEPDDGAREVLLNAMLVDERAERIILSNKDFFGAPRSAVRNGYLYPNAIQRLQHVQQLFPDDEIEMFMGLRDLAGFLPGVFKKSPKEHMLGFLGGVDPREMRWSETIRHIREQVPSIRITLWCNEDTPLIWGEIIREIVGLDANAEIEGAHDLLAEIMSNEGMRRFEAYLASHPVMTEIQCRRVKAAFLDKFAFEDQIDEELEVPGWTETLVAELAEIYDDDVIEISRMHGVHFITP